MSTCSFCNTEIPENRSKCPKCRKFNVPEAAALNTEIVVLADIITDHQERIAGGDWDPCFGGGIYPGSSTLLAGEPGVGKSTLLLQLASHVAGHGIVLYVPTEEGNGQLKDRAKRLKITNQDSMCIVSGLGGEVDLPTITDKLQPELIIIDSLPGFFGDIQPQRALDMINDLKQREYTVILSNHVNKNNEQAGYVVVEHAVDATMMIMHEQDSKGANTGKRILETTKNRHGAAPERVWFEMTEKGLVKCKQPEK